MTITGPQFRAARAMLGWPVRELAQRAIVSVATVNAEQHGYVPQVYACEALGLVFAFGNEVGATTFANNFGPANAATPNTPGGDATFAAEAANIIFGSAVTANTPTAIDEFVANWKAFYTSNGIPGIDNPSADQIDLAARGAAWGDAVGVALANNLGPFVGQTINFLTDAALSNANYGGSLATQPVAGPLEGGTVSPSAADAASQLHLIGVAAPEHMVV